jgi:hypothetical protein
MCALRMWKRRPGFLIFGFRRDLNWIIDLLGCTNISGQPIGSIIEVLNDVTDILYRNVGI